MSDALAAVSEGRWRDAAIGLDRHRVMSKCPGCNLWDAARAWERAGEADSALARYELSVTQVEGRADGGDVAVTLAPTYKRLGELYEAKGNVVAAERVRTGRGAGRTASTPG